MLVVDMEENVMSTDQLAQSERCFYTLEESRVSDCARLACRDVLLCFGASWPACVYSYLMPWQMSVLICTWSLVRPTLTGL